MINESTFLNVLMVISILSGVLTVAFFLAAAGNMREVIHVLALSWPALGLAGALTLILYEEEVCD